KEDVATKVGQLQIKYGARGSVSYSIEVMHQGLHKHRIIHGPDQQVIEAKLRLQVAEWNAQWEKRVVADQKVTMAYRAKELATERTAEAQRALQDLHEILATSLADSKSVDFESLKDRTPFPKAAPVPPRPPAVPEQTPIPMAPSRSDFRYRPELGLLDKLLPSRRIEKENWKKAMFEADMRSWEQAKEQILADHESKMNEYWSRVTGLETSHAGAVKAWEAERAAFVAKQNDQHLAMDAFRTRYESKDPQAIIEYCDLVLNSSLYPDCLPKEFEFDFNSETGVLVVNYKLPAPADIPTVTEVKFVQSSNSFTEKYLSEANAAKLYDEVIYQIALRTLNELLEADQAGALTSVVFNGFVTAVDKGTGNEVTGCIISLQASKETLGAINLAKVEPKACFRQLKGVGSSKLHSITPVAPIINLRKEDDRFVPSYGVADRLNEGFNLAAMDWEDFEHLIREIFEREFTASGGEVNVTQASRDGGVDAVALDPDPI